MKVPPKLIKKIIDSKKHNTFLIAIDGRGGSGKSTLAEMLKKKLRDATMLHLDDINYPINEIDREKIQKQILEPLIRNKLAKYQIYDYKNKKLGDWVEINPGGIVIIEGVSIFHNDLRSYFDFKIWVECPAEIGFKRGVVRELELTGKDTTKNWLRFMPEEEKYIQAQKPQEQADFTIYTAI